MFTFYQITAFLKKFILIPHSSEYLPFFWWWELDLGLHTCKVLTVPLSCSHAQLQPQFCIFTMVFKNPMIGFISFS